MTKEKEMKFKNSNLRFLGTKMDTNGNGCYIFKYPNGRAFTIQAHNFWNGSNFHLVKYPEDLFKFKTNWITPDDLEAAAIGYISVFGSKKQKEGLRVYKK